MKTWKLFQLVILAGVLACPGSAGADQAVYPYPFTLPALEPFYRQILTAVSEKAAALAYNYEFRPVIGTIVRDLADPTGRSTAVGRDLARFLRAELHQENQFFVYSRDQVADSLGYLLNTERPLTAEAMGRLQDHVAQSFKKPVHLIIGGTIWKTPENEIRALVYLFPFYRTLTPVDRESPQLNLERLYFTSAVLPPADMERVMAPVSEGWKPLALEPGYGRLVILSSYRREQSREQERQYMIRLDAGSSSEKPGALLALKQVELGDPENLSCWLDRQELAVLEKNRKQDYGGFYHNILNGLGADQVWFDAEVPEGDHHLTFSVFPVNSLNKKAVTFPFRLQAGVTTFIVVSALERPKSDPDITVRMVVDSGNRAYPF